MTTIYYLMYQRRMMVISVITVQVQRIGNTTVETGKIV
jgi:hypothetical protein